MKKSNLSIKLYADGADFEDIKGLSAIEWIAGFTTNPTLMKKAGVTDYVAFAKDVLEVVKDRPVSFEVFADDLPTMEKQARVIASWADNVYVKIPVTNTQGVSTAPLLETLAADGVQLNVTAIFTLEQTKTVMDALSPNAASVISVFAGRIADTGIDPVPLMREAADLVHANPKAELLWASPREVLNVVQAQESQCDIITATSEILKKVAGFGKDLDQFSLETVQMFYNDATAAGFTIEA